LGLGGTRFSQQHALDSATLCNAAMPEYLSVLTTSFPLGLDRIRKGFVLEGDDGGGNNNNDLLVFEPLTARENLQELKCFLEAIDMPATNNKTIVWSDHASNYLALKGRLGRDRDRLLQEVIEVLEAPEEDDVYNLRPEWARGL
jgi:hypothetical protein